MSISVYTSHKRTLHTCHQEPQERTKKIGVKHTETQCGTTMMQNAFIKNPKIQHMDEWKIFLFMELTMNDLMYHVGIYLESATQYSHVLL